MKIKTILFFSLISIVCSCQFSDIQSIETGAEQLYEYLPQLKGKNVAIVANHTSMIGNTHLVDSLIAIAEDNFNIVKVFAPEHGFRGTADAGEVIKDQVDIKTGLPIISLYGKNKKPTEEQMTGLDMLIFDIQDVGVRFYTYISTMHYVMEACAENDIELIVLDRPNPNGNYIDGPVLDLEFQSFVGMHPIPVVYGMTMGELAKMINGEGWLKGELQCRLNVIPCKNYEHSMPYSLAISPSPNLPNDHSIRMYPSTCFFEGTIISEGRGTHFPFEIYGHPELEGPFTFTPKAIRGMSMYPKFKGQVCFGEDLRSYKPTQGWRKLELQFLLDAYSNLGSKTAFFTPFFAKLAGTDVLQKQIEAGMVENEIRKSWEEKINLFKQRRSYYLLYPE